MAFNIRTPLLEVDFLNKIINEETRYLDQDTGTIKVAPGGRRVAFDDTASERFLAAAIDPFWHSAKDQLDFFQYYDDGTYFCQRKKLKTDFTTNTQYFATYQFSDGTADQAKQLYEQIKIFLEVANQVKNLKVEALVEEVDKEVLLYEKRYLKLKRQKNSLLELSDWRILPDVEDSWEGEKEMWKAWRAHVRTQVLKSPDEFDSGLAYFKYTYEYRFPVDPNVYREMYDGVDNPPAYLDANDTDQWVYHDIEASTDFRNQREQTMYNLSRSQGKISTQREIDAKVLEMMRLLRVDDIIPIDWNIYYVAE